MPTEAELNERVVDLADEELVRRLRNGGLTELATAVVQRELAARGICAEQVLAESVPDQSNRTRTLPTARVVLSFVWRRVLCFPLHAIRGAEPLWAVFVFGLIVLVAVFELTSVGMHHFLSTPRVAPDALMLSYLLLGIYALTAVWLGLALWRTARPSRPVALRFATRAFALLVVFNCVLGSIAAARLIHDHFKPPPAEGPSLMDSMPDQ